MIMTTAALSTRALLDHHEIVDALYRFAAGQDLEDEQLFLSAFSADAVLDFTQPASRFGVEQPPMVGITQIAQVMTILRDLQTTHTVTNPRVAVDGDSATMSALVEAQHVKADDPRAHLLLKNFYDLRLSRHGQQWRIDEMTIRTLWHHGDPAVLFGPAG